MAHHDMVGAFRFGIVLSESTRPFFLANKGLFAKRLLRGGILLFSGLRDRARVFATSLMNDQVNAINNKVGSLMPAGKRAAVFLGQGNKDRDAETLARGGHCALLYLTPEKLFEGGFMSHLQTLAASGKLGLFAIDEVKFIGFAVDFQAKVCTGSLRFTMGSGFSSVIYIATAVT
eukprot:764149-Hanusia_phi.AAC.1